jgi:hypothetical protein
MFQYRPWTLTNTGAVGGSSLYCYYTEEPCNKKIRKKAFRPALKITAMISRQEMSKEDGRNIFLAGSKMSLWDSHNFY